MPVRTVLVDFDGTITDAPKEAEPAIEKWHGLFADATGLPIYLVIEEVEKAKAEALRDKEAGWENSGRIVAPASADPYVLNNFAYQRLIRKYRNEWIRLPQDDASMNALLQQMFEQSHPFAGMVTREGAKGFMDALKRRFNTLVVTNSGAGKVKEKMSHFDIWDIPVVGNARKYVHEEVEGVPEYTRIEGLDRGVLLWRGYYKRILDGHDPETTAVVGDIFELDLALPEYLGFRVVQVETPTTPHYEISHHARRPGTNHFALFYEAALEFLSRRN